MLTSEISTDEYDSAGCELPFGAYCCGIGRAGFVGDGFDEDACDRFGRRSGEVDLRGRRVSVVIERGVWAGVVLAVVDAGPVHDVEGGEAEDGEFVARARCGQTGRGEDAAPWLAPELTPKPAPWLVEENHYPSGGHVLVDVFDQAPVVFALGVLVNVLAAYQGAQPFRKVENAAYTLQDVAADQDTRLRHSRQRSWMSARSRSISVL
jgi:hypothetical protein